MLILKESCLDDLKRKALCLKRTDYIILVLIGVLILVAAIPTGTKNQSQIERASYTNDQEKHLEEMLGKMTGVGRVKVMITLKDERGSQVEGVMVVAEGCDDSAVSKNISDAIMALFDVEAHKIKIVKMSKQEDVH